MRPEKSPVRLEIESEVMKALLRTDRSLTTAELIEVCPTASDKTELAKILNLMGAEGMIEQGEPRQPGEPGGMTGKGARAVNTWRHALGAPPKLRPAQASTPMPRPAPKTTTSDAALASEALRRMYSAEDDDAEACLDSAATSHGGDEGAHPVHDLADAGLDRFYQRMADEIDQADTERQTRDDERRHIRAEADVALIAMAHALLKGDPVWDAAVKMHAQITVLTERWT